MRWATAACLTIVLLWEVSCGRTAFAAAPIKLNGPLVVGGDTSSLRISPDGSRLVYRADQDTDEVDEIYSVPITGGMPVKLNGPLVAGGDVASFGGVNPISPDGTRVFYVADQDTNFVDEIYSVPIGGGAFVKLNGPMADSVADDADNQFSPISSRVLYLAAEDTIGVNELYSVLSTGGGQIKVNGPLVAGGDVSDEGFQFSSGGARVLYRADQDTNDVFEIYSFSGVAPVKLNGPLVLGGDVSNFRFRPDGVRVVYRADQDADEEFEIYSVLSSGGASVQLNGPLVAGGDVGGVWEISPDGARVLYRADQDADEVFEIYSVPSGGGAAVQLNGPLVAGGDASISTTVGDSAFSPDSSRVLYIADQFTDEVFELFSVPSGGGAPVKLNGTLAAGGDVVTSSYSFSPDSSRVVYTEVTDGVAEVFSVPSSGGTAVKLNGDLAPGGDAGSSEFSPDSSRVLYHANQVDGGVGLYIVPSAGGTTVNHTAGATPVKVSGPLVAGGSILSAGPAGRFSPDGSVVVYTADQETDGVFEVFARIVRQRSVGAGGSWDAGATWNHGVAPDEVMQVFIDGAANVTANGNLTPRSANTVQVGNNGGAAKLTLSSNAVITAINGVLVDNGGEVRGDGQIVGDVAIGALGGLRAGSNEQLRISGEVLNEGNIVASGLPAAPAEIEFDGNTGNFDSIAARFAILRFNGGLYSENDMTFVSGSSDVFGDVNNQGTIDISSNAVVTFHGDIHQDATLRVDQSGANTGVAVFLGAFTGSGGSTGGGNIFFEGDVRPGNSPATVDFDKNVAFGAAATLEIELGGTLPGLQHDQVQVAGNLSLDGTLAVSRINGFSPDAGDSFDILDWTTLSGTFDTLSLPPLDPGLMWNASRLYTIGALHVALAGDYNLDGVVDAADYTVWQDTLGASVAAGTGADGDGDGTIDPGDYDVWKSNFGNVAGSGASALAAPSSSVPEPVALILAVAGLLSIFSIRSRRYTKPSSPKSSFRLTDAVQPVRRWRFPLPLMAPIKVAVP